MDYTTEVVNITKIKDGFFLGDEATAANLDAIVQFKITHMINGAGQQIMNSWETIGIKYLTLNWTENSTQSLFDPRDEIANRIVFFVDDSTSNGEGLLVHSVRGQNRACLVILIYLIKKFRWTLAKSLEFLTNKKFDVQIPKYFLQQISFFETRLSKLGQGPKSNGWNDISTSNDPEEIILKNTYINGLIYKPELKWQEVNKHFNINSRRIHWADSNYNRKDLCSSNIVRDLILQKEIKPINSHKIKKPIKPCMKTKPNSHSNMHDVKKSLALITSTKLAESTHLQSNLNSYSSNNNALKDITSTSLNYNDLPNSNKHSNDLLKNYTNLNVSSLYPNSSLKPPPSFDMLSIKTENKNNTMSKSLNIDSNIKMKDNAMNISSNKNNDNPSSNSIVNSINNSSNNYKPISNSNTGSTYDYNNNMQSNTRQNNFKMNPNCTDISKTRSYSVGQDSNKNNLNNESNPANDSKIIIASKYQNIINNFNNIIIQSTDDLDKYKPNDYQNAPQNLMRPNSLIKRDNNQNNQGNYYNNNYSNSNGPDYMNININPLKNIMPVKKFDSQTNQPSYKDSAMNSSLNTKGTQDYLQKIQTRVIKDNQKLMQNNFLSNNSQINNNSLEKMKIIDHNTSSKSKIAYINQGNPNYNQSYNSQSGKSLISSSTTNKNNPVNNYQPDLIKKNITVSQNNIGILNRSTGATRQGPIKIQTDYDKKPLTPDNSSNYASLKLAGHSTTKNSNLASSNMIDVNYGTIKRSNSKQKNETNDRPSTAPQKEKDLNVINHNSSLKRLPSPMIKNTSNLSLNLSSSQKQNNTRQRAPSPVLASKNSTITIGSLKTGSKNLKWK